MTLIWINYSCAQRTIRTPTSFELWHVVRRSFVEIARVVLFLCCLHAKCFRQQACKRETDLNTFVASDLLSVECCVVGLVYIVPCFYPFIWREYINIIAAVYCGFHVLLCPGFGWVYLCAHKCEIPCQSPLGCYVNICLVQDRAQGRINVDSE